MRTIGIIGSGAMGSGIAQVFAAAGHRVYLYDADTQALTRAEQKLNDTLDILIAKGKNIPTEALRTIRYTPAMTDLKSASLLIEAVTEDLAVKRQVFQAAERIVDEDAVLASNTSSLSLSAIAQACERPERVVGLHFFNPAPLMALVEIIPALQTKPGLTQELSVLISQAGKTPVVAKDTPGFIVNRVARPFYGEAIRILEEGIADCATIDFALTTLGGFRMGPFALMDFIGHDVNYRVTESIFRAFFYDPKFKPSFTQKRLFDAGYYGRKSGRGFYDYREAHSKPCPSEDPALLERIYKRILIMLINEAADALFLGIATREDLDTAMTKGVNYPKGLLRWADEYGLSQLQQDIDALYDYYREDRYRLSPIIRHMAQYKQTFY